jgi:hypothetical protein
MMFSFRSLPRYLLTPPVVGALRAFAVAPSVLTNEQIEAVSMRVIFSDPSTGQNNWKIMARQEALDFAKKQKLDLVLGKWIVMCCTGFMLFFSL